MEMVRYCRSCDDEFRPDVLVCSDCGAALILQPEGVGARGAGDEGPGAPNAEISAELDSLPISSLIPVRTFDSLEDLEPAIAALSELPLPSRVLVQNGRYILLVRPENLGQAQTTLHEALMEPADATDSAFDASAGRYSVCPACGTALGPDFAGSCAECGLELSGPTETVRAPEAE